MQKYCKLIFWSSSQFFLKLPCWLKNKNILRWLAIILSILNILVKAFIPWNGSGPFHTCLVTEHPVLVPNQVCLDPSGHLGKCWYQLLKPIVLAKPFGIEVPKCCLSMPTPLYRTNISLGNSVTLWDGDAWFFFHALMLNADPMILPSSPDIWVP